MLSNFLFWFNYVSFIYKRKKLNKNEQLFFSFYLLFLYIIKNWWNKNNGKYKVSNYSISDTYSFRKEQKKINGVEIILFLIHILFEKNKKKLMGLKWFRHLKIWFMIYKIYIYYLLLWINKCKQYHSL